MQDSVVSPGADTRRAQHAQIQQRVPAARRDAPFDRDKDPGEDYAGGDTDDGPRGPAQLVPEDQGQHDQADGRHRDRETADVEATGGAWLVGRHDAWRQRRDKESERDVDTASLTNGAYHMHTLQVFTVTGSGISRNVVFQDPSLFSLFGLPPSLEAATVSALVDTSP